MAWLLAVAAALLPASSAAQPANCTVPAQNLFVRDVLQQYYYWYQFLPNPNPPRFGSPEAYLDAVRYRPLDEHFSYIASRAATDAFYSSSQFIGFGFQNQTSIIEDGAAAQMRVLQVYPDSPAAAAGLARGDYIVSVAGRTVTDWWLSGQLGEIFGPAEEGYDITFVYRRGEQAPVEASMTKQLVTIPTVSATRVYEVDGRKVGYIFFRNFVEPSVEALDVAFAQLREAGVRELVLDLRYNGGGLVSVAQHLGSLLGGVRANGNVFARYVHNDRNAFRNQDLRFEEKANWLTLDRLIVVTTRSSASASELVINGLRPFMPVVLIGDTTYGKPVGQYGFNFCDKTAFPVAFSMRNANDEGDYFGGIQVTCPAPDDIDHQIGDPAEGSLAEALRFIQTGTCSTEASLTAEAQRRDRMTLREHGLRQLIGAW
jgi:C-terminal peptidase prc